MMNLLKKFKSLLDRRGPDSVLFVDGDMPMGEALDILRVVGDDYDLICLYRINVSNPKRLYAYMENMPTQKIEIYSIDVYSKGKETTDKYIMASIQKYISNGLRDIGLVTGDFDFLDMRSAFEMINPGIEFHYEVYMSFGKRKQFRSINKWEMEPTFIREGN